jgi:hypothetical protein
MGHQKLWIRWRRIKGEGGSGWSLLAQATRSMLVGYCCLKGRNSISSSSLARHGGGRRGGDGAVALSRQRRPLPKGCYIDELNHAGGILASAILCLHGGESSTSDEEALLQICRWNSTPLCHQVVCPRWLGGGQRRRFFTKRGYTSNLPSTPRGRQRYVAEAPRDWIAYSSYVLECFFKI